MTAEVVVAGTPNLLAVHQEFPEDLAYAILQTIFDHRAEWDQIHPEAKNLNLQTAWQNNPVPLHPGAIRFYRDRGVYRGSRHFAPPDPGGVQRIAYTAPALLPAPAATPAFLELRDLDEPTRPAVRLPLGHSGAFALAFSHSMYGGRVTEEYRLAGGAPPRLLRTAIRTENAGAAEYYARYGEFAPEGAGWRVAAPPLSLADLVLRVDRTGRPALRTGAATLPLLDLVADGHRLRLRPLTFLSD
jgi:hypothetical protein